MDLRVIVVALAFIWTVRNIGGEADHIGHLAHIPLGRGASKLLYVRLARDVH